MRELDDVSEVDRTSSSFDQQRLGRRDADLDLCVEHADVFAEQLERLVRDVALIGVVAGLVAVTVKDGDCAHRVFDVLDETRDNPVLRDVESCGAVCDRRFDGLCDVGVFEVFVCSDCGAVFAVAGADGCLGAVEVGEVFVYEAALLGGEGHLEDAEVAVEPAVAVGDEQKDPGECGECVRHVPHGRLVPHTGHRAKQASSRTPPSVGLSRHRCTQGCAGWRMTRLPALVPPATRISVTLRPATPTPQTHPPTAPTEASEAHETNSGHPRSRGGSS